MSQAIQINPFAEYKFDQTLRDYVFNNEKDFREILNEMVENDLPSVHMMKTYKNTNGDLILDFIAVNRSDNTETHTILGASEEIVHASFDRLFRLIMSGGKGVSCRRMWFYDRLFHLWNPLKLIADMHGYSTFKFEFDQETLDRFECIGHNKFTFHHKNKEN